MARPLPSAGAVESDLDTFQRRALGECAAPCTLSCSVSGVRVSVSYGFVLMGLFLGVRGGARGSVLALSAITITLLVHEASRAISARALGRRVSIDLHAWSSDVVVEGPPLRGASKLALATVGSLGNVAIAALLWWSRGAPSPRMEWVEHLAWAQLAWGGVQLLPVPPFHAAVLLARESPRLRRLFAALSAASVVVIAGVLVRIDAPLLRLALTLAALHAVTTALHASDEIGDERLGLFHALERAERAVASERFPEGRDHAQGVLHRAASMGLRVRAWRAIAWSAIGLHDAPQALAALSQLPSDRVGPALVAAYLGCIDRPQEMVAFLERARARGRHDAACTRMLIDALVDRQDFERALEIAAEDAALLSPDDARRVLTALALERPSLTALAALVQRATP